MRARAWAPRRGFPPGGLSVPAPRPAPPQPLDINGADASALRTLPGIGPALARRIVADRESHGPFRISEDLLRVSGIGPQRYAALRHLVRTAEAP